MLNRWNVLFAGLALLGLQAHTVVAQGTWKQIGSLKTPRNAFPTAVDSANNLFLLGGRYTASGYITATTESVNPAATTPTFTKTGNLAYSRSYMPAVPISGTKKVLLPGGFSAAYGTLRTAELFDLGTRTSASTASMTHGREQYDAVQLAAPATGGYAPVLAIGGFNGNYNTAYATCELYTYSSGSTGRWSSTASLKTARFGTSSLLLPNGRIMVVGGRTEPGDASLSSVEYYTPAGGATPAAWVQSPAPPATPTLDSDWLPCLHHARFRHTMTVLGNDTGGFPIVLVAGGYSGDGSAGKTLNTAEIGVYDSMSGQYKFQMLLSQDPNTGQTSPLQMLFVNAGRMDHTATLVSSISSSFTTGQVFIVGGWDGITGGPGTTIALPELITVSLANGVFTGSITHLTPPGNFATRHEQAAARVTTGTSLGAIICGGLQVDSYGNTCLTDAWIYTAP